MEISAFNEGYFKEFINTLEVLAADPKIKNYMDGNEETHQQILMTYRHFEDANENIAFIYSAYENGYLLINDYTPSEEYDPTERPWYKVAMEAKPDTSMGLGILLPNTRQNEALIVAERLRDYIENNPVKSDVTDIYFTISIGLNDNFCHY